MTEPEIMEAARRLLEREGGRENAPATVGPAAAAACEQFVHRLADFVGRAGARALFDRGLVLTIREYPWLAACNAEHDSSPSLRLRPTMEANPASAWPASVALITSLVTLFATFVGWSLAARILTQYRPDAFPPAPPAETK